MSARSAAPAPSPPAALAAFLRGVERRGAVLAELQAGDAPAGDAAVAAAMRQFRSDAADAAMSDWPRRFWTLLLAQPQLRTRTAVALPLDATDRLAEIGGGPRATLLLRLAAGLDEDAAAAVLGVAPASYRLALQRALPHHSDGRADPEAWQRLREQIHRRIKTLPPDRLARLGHAREAALRGLAPEAAVAASPAGSIAGPAPRRGLLVALWLLLALCVVVLAATFWPGSAGWFDRGDAPRSRALPEEAPASRYGVEAGLIAHRDFAQLADPQATQADDLAFSSWLAAQAGSVMPSDGGALPAMTGPTVGAAPPGSFPQPELGGETSSETADAPR